MRSGLLVHTVLFLALVELYILLREVSEGPRKFRLRSSGGGPLSANNDETPELPTITVGRWKVRTDGDREAFDDVGWAWCPHAGG